MHPESIPASDRDPARFGAWIENGCLSHAWNAEQRVAYWREEPFEVDGVLVAQSTRPLVVFETGMPPRYYLPREDVLVDLDATATTSACAYKGEASYWAVTTGGSAGADVAWSYEEPLPDAAELAGAVAFYPDRAVVTVDEAPAGRSAGPAA